MDWAEAQMAGCGFEINELNKVVRDYAYIELELAAKDRRRTPFERLVLKSMNWVAVIGLIAVPVALVTVFSSSTNSEVAAVAFVACALGTFSILNYYVPWRRDPYRQADRTVSAYGVVNAVVGGAMIIAVLVVRMGQPNWWLIATPALILLGVAVWAVVGYHRFRGVMTPPQVDFDRLSSEDEQVLIDIRRRALLRLRVRMVISYDDVRKYGKAPLIADAARPS